MKALTIVISCYSVKAELVKRLLDSLKKGKEICDFDVLFIYSKNQEKNYISLLKKYNFLTITSVDKTFLNKNEKIMQNLNLVKTKYIQVFDPDDWVIPEILQLFVKRLENINEDVIQNKIYLHKNNKIMEKSGVWYRKKISYFSGSIVWKTDFFRKMFSFNKKNGNIAKLNNHPCNTPQDLILGLLAERYLQSKDMILKMYKMDYPFYVYECLSSESVNRVSSFDDEKILQLIDLTNKIIDNLGEFTKNGHFWTHILNTIFIISNQKNSENFSWRYKKN